MTGRKTLAIYGTFGHLGKEDLRRTRRELLTELDRYRMLLNKASAISMGRPTARIGVEHRVPHLPIPADIQ